MAKPACINDVQRLAGRVAALSRFISRFGEKALPLYQMMKKTDTFIWSDDANTAFEGHPIMVVSYAPISVDEEN